MGHSADGKNVALWDTLMPQRRSLVERLVQYNAILFFFQQGCRQGSYRTGARFSGDSAPVLTAPQF